MTAVLAALAALIAVPVPGVVPPGAQVEKAPAAEEAPARLVPRHFTECPRRTGASSVLIVPASAVASRTATEVPLGVGDEVAVVAPDGSCAGVGVWDGDGIAVTVWEDDPFTPERDGLSPGDPLQFATYDADAGTVRDDLEVSYTADFGAETGFSRNALYIVGAVKESGEPAPDEPGLDLAQNFPNPVRAHTTLPFSVEESGPVSLEVFDALGRLVARPVAEHRTAGAYEVPLDASALAPGLYVYRLTAGGEVSQRTLTVAR